MLLHARDAADTSADELADPSKFAAAVQDTIAAHRGVPVVTDFDYTKSRSFSIYEKSGALKRGTVGLFE